MDKAKVKGELNEIALQSIVLPASVCQLKMTPRSEAATALLLTGLASLFFTST